MEQNAVLGASDGRNENARRSSGAWSYSSLKLFEQCPRRYQIEKITHEVESKATFHLRWGNEVHSYVERRVKRLAPLPDFLQHIEPMLTAFEQSGYACRAEVGFAITAGLQPRSFDDPSAWARGYIDFIAIPGNFDHAYILDWKTGKRRPDAGQLELYALALASLGIKRSRTAFIWLAHQSADRFDFNENHLPFMLNRFKARAQKLAQAKQEDKWPTKPSALCAWCPAVRMCEAGREYRDKARQIEEDNERMLADYDNVARSKMQEGSGHQGDSERHTQSLRHALQQTNLVHNAG